MTKGGKTLRDGMLECEVKKQYLVGEKREWRWVRVPVSKVFDATATHIRCMFCHGAVKVLNQQTEQGPQECVEHRVRTDSEGCPGGSYFQGTPRMSAKPIK